MSENGKRSKVMIVDDSAVVRTILSRELSRDSEFDIVTACDPIVAHEKILHDKPDVLILDVEMPRMDGLTFLKKVMKENPIPSIIFSSRAESGTRVAIDALEAGALDIFAKPSGGMEDLGELVGRLADCIRAATRASLPFSRAVGRRTYSSTGTAARAPHGIEAVIAMGASTGGTEALKAVLTALPPESPGILVVLHMPEGFTQRYAMRLDELCRIGVREAVDGDRVRRGEALLAPGGQHMALARHGDGFQVRVTKSPPVNRHRPSVEVLFRSVAESAGPRALGIILTGMGSDGSDGLLEMRKAGAHTIAQDEATCVVYGMPREAVVRGAVAEVLPLDQISAACMAWCR